MARGGIGDRVEGFHAVEPQSQRAARFRCTSRSSVSESAPTESCRCRTLYRRRSGERDDVRDAALTSAPQGVVAVCRPKRTVSLEDAVATTDPPAVLVFDHLDDQRNLGTAIRSAVAAGLRSVVVPKRRAAPIGAAAFKAAAGTLEEVSLVEVTSIPEALRRLGPAWGVVRWPGWTGRAFAVRL